MLSLSSKGSPYRFQKHAQRQMYDPVVHAKSPDAPSFDACSLQLAPLWSARLEQSKPHAALPMRPDLVQFGEFDNAVQHLLTESRFGVILDFPVVRWIADEASACAAMSTSHSHATWNVRMLAANAASRSSLVGRLCPGIALSTAQIL